MLDGRQIQALHRRQEVTGLIVNDIVNVDRKYIRQIRAMLYALRKHGLDAAEKEYYQNYRHKEPSPYKKPPMGDDALRTLCKNTALSQQTTPDIFVFDCDNQDIVNEMSENGTFKSWNNNTFSLVLPIPVHRKLYPYLCIEMYYTDEEIKTPDDEGRRLFLSNEFHPLSGKHLTIHELNSLEMNKIKNINRVTILDNAVYNSSHKNVALTKNKFAQYVLTGQGDFANFDPSPFEELFIALEKIANLAT